MTRWATAPVTKSKMMSVALAMQPSVKMMGTFFDSTGGVIAAPMALYFILWFGSGMVPGLVYISPLLLTFTPDETKWDPLSTSLMLGDPVFSWFPLIATLVFCTVFIAVAIWRFNRQEF